MKQINERYTATEHELWQAGKDFKQPGRRAVAAKGKGAADLGLCGAERVPVGSVYIVALVNRVLRKAHGQN